MKKRITIGVVALILCFSLAACGEKDTSLLSDSEVKLMRADADEYKHRTVRDLPLRISNVQINDGMFLYQGYDDENGSNNAVILKSEKDLDLKNQDYVLAAGSVAGKLSNDDSRVIGNSEMAVINATDVKKSDLTVFNLAKKTIQVNETKTQKNVSVTLEKVEIAEESTRVYFTIKNDSSDQVSVEEYNSYIKQENIQYDKAQNAHQETNLKTTINYDVESSGRLAFEAMENADAAFTVTFSLRSQDYTAELKPYKFEITP